MNYPNRYPSYPPTSPSRIPASSAVSPNAYPDEDWTKISDLSERRRIQNRIAQRNYRQKMKLRSEGKAPTSPPDRARRKMSASQERDTTSSRLKSTAGTANSYMTQHTQASQPTAYHGDIQGVTYTSPGMDNSYFASAPESYPYSQPAQSELYDTAAYANYYQYSDCPEYYPESSLEPSQYPTTDQQFYAPESGLASYELDSVPSSLNTQLAHTNVYTSPPSYPNEMMVPDGQFTDPRFLNPYDARYK